MRLVAQSRFYRTFRRPLMHQKRFPKPWFALHYHLHIWLIESGRIKPQTSFLIPTKQ
nr:MAG TPA: hypothetical protein [Caudoviricetes sp.]